MPLNGSEFTFAKSYFCGEATQKLAIGDFDGDSMDDVLCVGMNAESSTLLVAIATEPILTYIKYLCDQEYYKELLVGNIDGFMGDDLFCMKRTLECK